MTGKPSLSPVYDDDGKVIYGQIFFCVSVDQQRAEYLVKCLAEPLCKHCGLERAECEADPCAAAQHEHDSFVDPAEYRGADYDQD